MAARPTFATVRAAAADLQNIVCDVPFESDVDRGIWLAGALTMCARQALGGALTPLFALDANSAGTGKTMSVAEAIGGLYLGHRAPVMSPPESDAEMRKSLTAIGLAKDSMVVLDNAVGAVDFPSLDAVLTSREFRARRLGENTADAHMQIWFDAVIFITGSNLRFPTKSIARRTLRIRITTAERHPERRKVFKHGMGLLDHVLRNRKRYVTAALTVLRGFMVLPDTQKAAIRKRLTVLGSFKEWSELIAAAVLYATDIDVLRNREGFAEEADVEAKALDQLIAALTMPLGSTREAVTADRKRLGAGLTADEFKERADHACRIFGLDGAKVADEVAIAVCEGLKDAVGQLGGAEARYSKRSLALGLANLVDRSTGTHALRRRLDPHSKVSRFFAAPVVKGKS